MTNPTPTQSTKEMKNKHKIDNQEKVKEKNKKVWHKEILWGKYITPYVFIGFKDKKTAEEFNYPEYRGHKPQPSHNVAIEI